MKNQGLEMDNYDIFVSSFRKKSLINHFIREVFGEEWVSKDVPLYSAEEYYRVIQKVTQFPRFSLRDIEIVLNYPDVSEEEGEILLSFVKNYALDFIRKKERCSVKDCLAHHLAMTAFIEMKDVCDLLGYEL